MTSPLKPLILYGGVVGPNPSKVAYLLASLHLPFTRNYIPFNKVKDPSYTIINPNGRLPSLTDPNKDITIWESGAIIEYLISEYDPEHTLSFPRGTKEDYLTKQWLFFQVSGQGPYYGQGVWFKAYHPEKVQSAIDRYVNEIKRITAVLEGVLEGKTWLVGEKCTYADLAFISWQAGIGERVMEEEWMVKDFPNVWAWLERMRAREEIRAVWEEGQAKKKEIFARTAEGKKAGEGGA